MTKLANCLYEKGSFFPGQRNARQTLSIWKQRRNVAREVGASVRWAGGMRRPAMRLTVAPRQTEIAKVDQRLRFGKLVHVYM